uniref:Uncharacterized protein n=1 Tax=Glossina brevipalpis TaxID=37001 RepID=A0A1A9WPY2_9MUSC
MVSNVGFRLESSSSSSSYMATEHAFLSREMNNTMQLNPPIQSASNSCKRACRYAYYATFSASASFRTHLFLIVTSTSYECVCISDRSKDDDNE